MGCCQGRMPIVVSSFPLNYFCEIVISPSFLLSFSFLYPFSLSLSPFSLSISLSLSRFHQDDSWEPLSKKRKVDGAGNSSAAGLTTVSEVGLPPDAAAAAWQQQQQQLAWDQHQHWTAQQQQQWEMQQQQQQQWGHPGWEQHMMYGGMQQPYGMGGVHAGIPTPTNTLNFKSRTPCRFWNPATGTGEIKRREITSFLKYCDSFVNSH